MKPKHIHVIGNIMRNGDIGRKLNEKYREGYSLFSTTMLTPKKKGVHKGILVFALELDQPFNQQSWVARSANVPSKYLEKYDIQPETKTKKGRKKKRR